MSTVEQVPDTPDLWRVAFDAFEKLKAALAALRESGEEGVDEAVQMHQDILWWVLGQGARDDGPNAGYLVTLRRRVKDGDAERALIALSMVQGVASVLPYEEDHRLHMAEQRIRSELMDVALGRAR
jgi:hypothetical protein